MLEFQGLPTAPAAAYPILFSEHLAAFLHDSSLQVASAKVARSSATWSSGKVVKRHTLRGTSTTSMADKKRAEDDASRAGMRNPATVVREWPKLSAVMSDVAEVLSDCHRKYEQARSLDQAFGKDPARSPPSDAVVAKIRQAAGGPWFVQGRFSQPPRANDGPHARL